MSPKKDKPKEIHIKTSYIQTFENTEKEKNLDSR